MNYTSKGEIMQGKIHPYWYIPVTEFPWYHTIRTYQSDWGWWQTFETDNPDVIFPSGYFNTNANDYVTITFNSKVSQFTLTEKVYTTNNNPEDKHFVYERSNTIYCYYPDDFEIVATLTPGDGSLSISDLDNLFVFKGTGNPSVQSNTFNHYNKLYIGRAYNYGWAWVMELNPCTLAESKNITGYDFVLMKYIYWHNSGHKAIISDRNYYPLGWFDSRREYWTLLNKNVNERLYCVRRGGWYGIGISEIQYLKLL